MVELSGRFDLTLEASFRIVRRSQFFQQELDRDVAFHASMSSFEHVPHAAATKGTLDNVIPDDQRDAFVISDHLSLKLSQQIPTDKFLRGCLRRWQTQQCIHEFWRLRRE